jgi:hypothetical protein
MIDYDLNAAGRVEIFNPVTARTIATLPGWTLRLVRWAFTKI